MGRKKESMKRAMFVGRWQPCHLGHEWLIRQKLDAGVGALVLVRDIVPGPGNPFTTEQTIRLLEAAFKDEDVIIMAIPDIESINWGRGVGYTTEDHGACPVKGISGSAIREMMTLNNPRWRGFVSPQVANYLETQQGGQP